MKIKFKKIDESALKGIYPVIDYIDYEFLQGQEMVLDHKAHDELEKNKFLSLGEYQVSLELIDIIQNTAISDVQKKVHAAVEERFIFSEEVVDILMTGVEMNKNVILYGRGGHGKSEITELVLDSLYKDKAIKNEAFVQACGDGLTEEKLFGGMNIKKYKDEGVIEYLPEFSFMNHEIVVLEEIFDAPPQILLALKDIITSKKFRQGHQTFDVKTKLIIGLTNKSKEEFGEDNNSLKALSERFPLTMKVEWTKYTKTNFLKLFQKVFGNQVYEDYTEKLTTLANIIDLNNTNGKSFVSPRTAVYAAEVYMKGKPLEYISEIDKDILIEYNKKVKDEIITNEQRAFIRKLEEYIDLNELELISDSEEFLAALDEIDVDAGLEPMNISKITKGLGDNKNIKKSKVKYLLDVINRTVFTENNFKQSTSLKKRLNHIATTLKDTNG